jgi:hypothetical protein
MKRPSAVSLLPSAFALLIFASSAAAQRTTHPLEAGVETGVSVGLPDSSDKEIHFPVAVRFGVFLDKTKSVEARFSETKASDDVDYTAYRAEIGFLYHFLGRSQSDLFPLINRPNEAYVRPFVGRQRLDIPNVNENEDVLGIGVGAKIPLTNALTWRSEINATHFYRHHLFDSRGFNVFGVLTGISVIVR